MKSYYHCKDINNFGDVVPVYVMKKLYGIDLEWSNTTKETLYMFAGSCMSEVCENVICSCLGFNSSKEKIKEKPKAIVSVRGPLTRKMILDQGLECPEVYFDMVNLLPHLFTKPNSKSGTVVIPHYVDNELFKDESGFVNICSGVENVVKECLKAKNVVTSSLHVMILCEVFKLNYEFKRPINKIAGDGMKYFDYFEAIGKEFKEGSY